MKHKLISFIILGFAGLISLAIISGAQAQQDEMKNISFPIKELGNCGDKNERKNYCDKQENQEACIDFAEANNLMDGNEAKAARFVIKQKGPGGCASKQTCETYCDNMEHIDECVAFAEQNNLMSSDELVEAKKVQNAIRDSVKPPACGSKSRCDVYCNESDHIEECMTFALQAGLMPEDEKEEAQKVLKAVKSGAKLPNCRGKKECDVYCAQESHFEECMNFAQAAGFMSAEEAEMARKTGGKGPGGCRGKEECDAYREANQEECFQFGVEKGLIPQEELRRMEQGSQEMIKMFNEASQEMLDCLNVKLGTEKIQAIKNGGMISQRDGEIVKVCNEEFARQNFEGDRSTFGDFINNNVPPEIRGCVSSNLNPAIFDENGDNHEIIDQVIRKCFEQTRPVDSQNYPSQNFEQMPGSQSLQPLQNQEYRNQPMERINVQDSQTYQPQNQEYFKMEQPLPELKAPESSIQPQEPVIIPDSLGGFVLKTFGFLLGL